MTATHLQGEHSLELRCAESLKATLHGISEVVGKVEGYVCDQMVDLQASFLTVVCLQVGCHAATDVSHVGSYV